MASPPGASIEYINLATIGEELQYLDKPEATVPQSLPRLALWVALFWQQGVAADELPVLAGTILAPHVSGGVSERSSARAERWAASVRDTGDQLRLRDQAATLLAGCPVPEGTLGQQIGTPLMVHTVSKAAAVVAAAVNSVKQVPGTVRPATSAVRIVTLTGYRVTNVVKSLPRRVILAGLAMLLVGGVERPVDPAVTEAAAPATRSWIGFAAVLTAMIMNILDSTIVNVAAPAIQADLRMSSSALEWIAAAYTLATQSV